MNISCDQCHSKFNIPDEKIPAGKTVTIKCPKCENRFGVSAPTALSDEVNGKFSEEAALEKMTYDVEDKPYSFVDENVKTALICEADETIRNRIKSVLSHIGYQISQADDYRSALRSMRYHVYDLLVVNELFGSTDPNTNGILIYMERMWMSIRRNMFVTLLTSRFRTMDQMMAFNKSVDLIVNIENISDFEKILLHAVKEKEAFYRIFKDTMKRIGRI
jgi:predicted Zn finger-like uncharacterized protein